MWFGEKVWFYWSVFFSFSSPWIPAYATHLCSCTAWALTGDHWLIITMLVTRVKQILKEYVFFAFLGPHRLTDTPSIVSDLSYTRSSTLNRTHRPHPGKSACLLHSVTRLFMQEISSFSQNVSQLLKLVTYSYPLNCSTFNNFLKKSMFFEKKKNIKAAQVIKVKIYKERLLYYKKKEDKKLKEC